MIRYDTMEAAAGALGIPREQLAALKAAGASGFDPSGTVNVSRVFAWIADQLEKGGSQKVAERLSLARSQIELNEAKTRKLKLEEAERMGILMPADKVVEWITKHLTVPITNLLNSAPMMLGQPCNPQNPQVASSAIREWIEKQFKPALRGAMEKGLK